MPVWLLWLLPVLLAVPAAVVWVSWSGRTRRPVEARESVRDYERFREALARPVRPLSEEGSRTTG